MDATKSESLGAAAVVGRVARCACCGKLGLLAAAAGAAGVAVAADAGRCELGREGNCLSSAGKGQKRKGDYWGGCQQ